MENDADSFDSSCEINYNQDIPKTNEIKIYLNKIIEHKNDNDKILENIRQINTILQYNREGSINNIREIKIFLEKNLDLLSVKIIIKIFKNLSKLLSFNFSLQLILCSNFYKLLINILKNKINSEDDNKNLIKCIGNLLEISGNHLSKEIKNDIDDIETNCLKEDIPKEKKIILFKILIEFIKNSPIVFFNQLSKDNDFLISIISINYKNEDIVIRQTISELTYYFFRWIKNRDFNTKKNYFQIIYDLIVNNFKSGINEETDINSLHGSILLIKSIILIKELFRYKSKEIFEILFKYRKSRFLPIKNTIVEYIPNLYNYLEDNEKLLEQFCNFLIDDYILNNNESINSILLSLKKLSNKIDKNIFEIITKKFLLCFSNKFHNSNYIINCYEIQFVSELLINYSDLILNQIDLEFIFDKIFESGFNETHVVFLEKIINLYSTQPKNEIKMIKIILVSLNVVSLILSKKIDLLNSFKNILQYYKTLTKKEVKKCFIEASTNIKTKIGKLLIDFLEKEQKSKITFESVKLKMVLSSFKLLKKINHPSFAKDILIFYRKSCFPLLKQKIKSVQKIEIISLITSSWFNYNNTDNEINQIVEYILEDLLNYYLKAKKEKIKKAILENFDERFDVILSKENFLKKIFFIFEFADYSLKVDIMRILNRLKKHIPIISNFIKKEVNRIFKILEFSDNVFEKEKELSLLNFYIKNLKDIIIEYFDKSIFEILIKEINSNKDFYYNQSYSMSDIRENDKEKEKECKDDLNLKIASIFIELVSSSFSFFDQEEEKIYYKQIFDIFINLLNESTDNKNQEIYLKTILAIFENSVNYWSEYNDFFGLFNTLISILKKSNSNEARIYSLKIFGYIGAIDADNLQIFLDCKKNISENNSRDENIQIFDENESEKNFLKFYKKKFLSGVANYLNNISKYTDNLGFELEPKKSKNQLLNDVISSLITILNNGNKKEHVKDILDILKKIIIYLREKEENRQNKGKESNITEDKNEYIELILNSFLKHPSRNIKKESKIDIIFCIIINFKNKIIPYYEDLLDLVIDAFKNPKFIDISLSILIELLHTNFKSITNYSNKLITILLDLLNKKSEECGSILIIDDFFFVSKIIDCLAILGKKVSDSISIILDDIFDLLSISLIDKQDKFILSDDSEENLDDLRNRSDKNVDNIIISEFQIQHKEKKKRKSTINFENEENIINDINNNLFNSKEKNYMNGKTLTNNININTTSPLKNNDLDLSLNKNSNAFLFPSSPRGQIMINRKKNINENIFKKILEYIKTVISYENFNDYIPKLIIIIKKYICFCPESRDDIIDLFNNLLKPRQNEMSFYLSSMSDLIYKYDESIIPYLLKWKYEFDFKFDSLPEELPEEEMKIKQMLEEIKNNNQSQLEKDNSFKIINILNKSLSSQEEKNVDIKQVFEKIYEGCNPKNFTLEDEWKEWFNSCSKLLFNNSPNKIIRYCSTLNDSLPNLYKYAFYEIWKNLDTQQKIDIVAYLTIINENKTLPNDIRLILLNLVEFIQREQAYLGFFENLDLSNAARKCKAYAKELYYLENYYLLTNDKTLLKRIMDLYYELNLPESVVGISIEEKNNPIFKKDDWFIKLRKWDLALERIKEKRKNEPPYNIDLIMDNYACLEGLSDWNNLLLLDNEIQSKKDEIFINENDDKKYNKINYYMAESALNLNKWDKLKMSVSEMIPDNDDEKLDKTLYEVIIKIHDDELSKAKQLIEQARLSLLDKVKILLKESYERAYKLLLFNDNLYQLEEIIQLKDYQKNNLENIVSKKSFILNKENLKNRWDKRMKNISKDPRTHEKILAIRNLVLNYEEDYEKYLDLAKICRDNDEFKKSMNILERLNQNTNKIHISLSVTLSMSKCFNENYELGNNNIKAKDELEKIIKEISQFNYNDEMSKKLRSKFYCYYGFILMNQFDYGTDKKNVNNILEYFKLSTKYDPSYYKAWHLSALLNYKYFEYAENDRLNYAINAIEGFTKSICIGKNITKILQDLLLLLDIWFRVGNEEIIDKIMNEKIEIISIDIWSMVIPQLITRINKPNPLIRKTLISILKKIGLNNPKSLAYPLTVLKNSKSKIRAEVVSLILEDIKKKHEKLFEESELIINELNRCALCLHEQWMEAIEESAKFFFKTKDYDKAIQILSELHKKMEIPPKTMSEIHFHQLFKSQLKEASLLLKDFSNNHDFISMNEAWNIYQKCYILMSEEFSNIEYMDLKSISPALFYFRESEIEIPGFDQNMRDENNNSNVKISSFNPKLLVLRSKEKPRKIIIHGSDGKEYPYLLKGHEDIRQDERVMQLFGLINTLISKDPDTRRKNLSIKRYPVIPLSHNTGIIGWVSNCDTLNQLIKEYRKKNNIPVNIEYQSLKEFHHQSDSSIKMTKLEVFQHSLSNTAGIDINQILWIKSQNAKDWLDRRTYYSRSLAVMSIVGYILGLGDRHPSNIMLDRISGKIIHIDFADCFEVAMKRDKFPEKVPFRLTRMLIKALGIGGIEGTFRITCENIMRVMRENKDSLNVILAAFVHDPLTSFRLLIPLIMKNNKNKNINQEKQENIVTKGIIGNAKKLMGDLFRDNKKEDIHLEKKRIGSDERQLFYELEEKDDMELTYLNQIVKIVLERVSDKLKGTDFNKNEELKINVQVQRLIRQATSHENLSQSYMGWCPFW